jgi:hypothetical protein
MVTFGHPSTTKSYQHDSNPGLRQILAAAGALIAVAGLYQLVRGGQAARWVTGLAGFAAAAFSGYLLIQLARTMRVLGGDSMVIARSGPGPWMVAVGSAVAFATLFFPPSSQATLRRESGRPALAWVADRESTGLRRGLQVALGLIWLADASLQYQPYMFTRASTASMLTPMAMGQPAFVSGPVRSGPDHDAADGRPCGRVERAVRDHPARAGDRAAVATHRPGRPGGHHRVVAVGLVAGRGPRRDKMHGHGAFHQLNDRTSGERSRDGPVIARLGARGLIEPLESEDRRRPYRITTAGAQALAQQSERMSKVASVASEWLNATLGWAGA